MNHEALHKMLERLLAQAQLDVSSAGGNLPAGQVHLIFVDGKESLDIEHLKLILKAIAENGGSSQALKVNLPAEEHPGGPSIQLMTIVVNAGVEGADEQADPPPRTLRDAIDREWPW